MTPLSGTDRNLPAAQVTMPVQQRQFLKGLERTLATLVSKYEPQGLTQHNGRKGNIVLPALAKPCKKPPPIDPDDFSEDEQYYKHRAQLIKYKAWRYSLLCANNVVQHPVEVSESPRKESPSKLSRHGARANVHISANEMHMGRSPNLMVVKRTVINRQP